MIMVQGDEQADLMMSHKSEVEATGAVSILH